MTPIDPPPEDHGRDESDLSPKSERPTLVTGFILVLILTLVALLVIGIVLL